MLELVRASEPAPLALASCDVQKGDHEMHRYIDESRGELPLL